MKIHSTFFWCAWAILLLISLCLQSAGLLVTPSHYHDFADPRLFAGFSLDVLSNIAFLLVGIWGIWRQPHNIHVWIILLGGIGVCFGSGYYHLAPDDFRLLWDRLPIAIVFSGIFTYHVYQLKLCKLNEVVMSIGYVLFSIFTVLLWYIGSLHAQNWIGPYVFLQFGGMLLLILMACISDKHHAKTIVYVLLCYIAAKLCEHFDAAILENYIVSGHTLKHLLAAFALYIFTARVCIKTTPFYKKLLLIR